MKSSPYYRVVRQLYYYRSRSILVLAPRLLTIVRTTKTVIGNPRRFLVKPFRLLYKDPKKLFQILLGQRTIQDWQDIQEGLTGDYKGWTDQQLKNETAKSANKDSDGPLISLITPVFDPPLAVLAELVHSVKAQTYPTWELLLYSFGKSAEIEEFITKTAAQDSRIKSKIGLENKGISANSNACLVDVKGEFTGLLDHDDILSDNALSECVNVIQQKRADFIYSDKDKISATGECFEPFFKPDWSPEMAIGGNYLTHFNLMRTSLIRDVGAWDSQTDGAQDWDLFLRIIERTKNIVHIPKILYHWRMVTGSTAVAITAKPYVLDAQKTTLQKHFKASGLEATAFHDKDGQMYVDWPVVKKPRAIIIQLLYKNLRGTEKLVRSIINQPDFHQGSRVFLLTLPRDFSQKYKARLNKFGPKLELIEYQSDDFARTVVDKLGQTKFEDFIFVADSTSKITKQLGSTPWASQLLGWLDIKGVGLSGGLAQTAGGRVVDCGSYYDVNQKRFHKYYFGTGFRSGYNGYLQWIRNFIMPSERLFAFKKSLLTNLGSSQFNEYLSIGDHDFPALLALANFAAGGRAVYDPTVCTIDQAPFYLSVPLSDKLQQLIANGIKSLNSGDPYYNSNLNTNYCDPQPRVTSDSKEDPAYASDDFMNLFDADGFRAYQLPGDIDL